MVLSVPAMSAPLPFISLVLYEFAEPPKLCIPVPLPTTSVLPRNRVLFVWTPIPVPFNSALD